MRSFALLLATAFPLVVGGVADDACGQQDRKTNLVDRFDKDKSGWLDRAERDAARAELARNPRPDQRGSGPAAGTAERTAAGTGEGTAEGTAEGPTANQAASPPEQFRPHKPLRPDTVQHFKGADLYKTTALRTIFLEFADKDWDEELSAFYHTDVCVPAKMTVDGVVYPNIGVRYRGNTSYSSAGKKKRSLNLITDLIDTKQRLYGYKTLNLLNGHTDPSFVRDVVFARICRQYMPASKSNLVRVVINGESWGIYSNVQQINKDFTKDNFDTRGGVRFKVPTDIGGDGGMRYLGEDVAAYEACYELKSGNAKEPWKRLIRACYLLERSNDDLLESGLASFLDVDEVLWHLALDNIFAVFPDGAESHSRASDYVLYEDPTFRYHLLFDHDNSVMRGGGTGGGGPLDGMKREDRTLLFRVLNIPSLRARYLHHVKVIRDDWLDWSKIGPVLEQFHRLIDDDVKQDSKRLYTYDAFADSLERKGGAPDGRRDATIRGFIEARRKTLINHPSLQGPWPTITKVEATATPVTAGEQRIQVRVEVGDTALVAKVLLYTRDRRLDPFQAVVLHDDGKHEDGAAGDGVFGGRSPAFAIGRKIRYYVEARAGVDVGTTSFYPRKAEGDAISFRFTKPVK